MPNIVGLDIKQFRDFIVKPTLDILGLGGRRAENLLIGTALVESRLSYLRQIGGGPAHGIFQCEENTHDDIIGNYLRYKPDLMAKIRHLMCINIGAYQQLEGNLFYATAIARVHYLRKPAPLPDYDDAQGMADYHKKWYNTAGGATNPKESVVYFIQAITSE